MVSNKRKVWSGIASRPDRSGRWRCAQIRDQRRAPVLIGGRQLLRTGARDSKAIVGCWIFSSLILQSRLQQIINRSSKFLKRYVFGRNLSLLVQEIIEGRPFDVEECGECLTFIPN